VVSWVRRFGTVVEESVAKAAVMLSNKFTMVMVSGHSTLGWFLWACLAVGSRRGGNGKLRCCCDRIDDVLG